MPGDEICNRCRIPSDARLPTISVIAETQEGEAEIIARERAVVCGLGVVEAVFTRFDWRTRVRMKVSDGDPIAPGGVVASVRSPAAALLAGERTALNFLQRLSGIATLTQAFVTAAEGAKIRVTDTRKTTPGLRALEKYAVRVGGGASHRFDLASGILLKDNHIALVGSVREAVRRARANGPHVLRVVVEVDDLGQLDEALEAGAEGILLDNFQVRDMAEAVKRARAAAPGRDRGVGPASRSIASTTSPRPASTWCRSGRSRTRRGRWTFRARSGRPTGRASGIRRPCPVAPRSGAPLFAAHRRAIDLECDPAAVAEAARRVARDPRGEDGRGQRGVIL